VEVAWLLAEECPQGAYFVPLAEVDRAEGVAGAIADQLGLREQRGGNLEQLLAQTLRHQKLLLVLDNLEHVLSAGAVVGRLLEGAPQLRVLTTSRQALDVPGESEYRVSALPFPDPSADDIERPQDYPAVEVFLTRARMARPDFALSPGNVRSVVEICARLDGLPLAINLTAAASRIFSPADIARALRDRLELPSAEDPQTHRGLRAALDWSWQLLEPSQRMLLARLAVFAGSCTLEGVEAVCSVDGDHGDLLKDLAALESKSLLEVAHGGGASSRFVMLETVRRYGLERLRDAGLVDELSAHHCAYYVRLVEAAEPNMTGGPDQMNAYRILNEEFGNLTLAFHWALDQRPEQALRLAAGLWRFFTMRRISEGRRWLEAVLERAPLPSVLRIRALNGAAVLARQQSELDVADTFLDEAIDLGHGLDAGSEFAFAILNRGIVEEQRANYDRAEEYFQCATALYEELGEARGVGHGLNCLGVIALRRGETALASSRFLESLGRFRALKDQWSIALSATNLGWIAEMGQQLDEARSWYEESHQIWENIGDQHGLARSAADLGRVARLQKDCVRAAELLEHALQAFHRLGDARMAAACLVELGAVAALRRRRELAARLLGAAEAVRESLGMPAWPDEQELEEKVLAELGCQNAEGVLYRARSIGRAFSLEDAVALVECGSWPPVSRRRPA
jgi:predicted ATPase